MDGASENGKANTNSFASFLKGTIQNINIEINELGQFLSILHVFLLEFYMIVSFCLSRSQVIHSSIKIPLFFSMTYTSIFQSLFHYFLQ